MLAGGAIAAALYASSRGSARESAANSFTEALEGYRAPVGASAAPFRSEEERNRAALARFRTVAEEHAGTAPAAQARLYAAHCLYNLSEWDEARRAYLGFAEEHARGLFAPYARLSAAKCLEQKRVFDRTAEEYRTLSRDESAHAVAPEAAYHAGRMGERLSDVGAARESYQRVIALFPDSAFARQARERLANLPPLAVAAAAGGGSPAAGGVRPPPVRMAPPRR